MRKAAVFATAAAWAMQLATPAFAFDRNTMLGAPRFQGPAAMGYVRVPFGGSSSHSLPRAGLMISAPGAATLGRPLIRSAVPGAVDFGFTGKSFDHPWTATLNVSDRVAWAADPAALPKNTPHLMGELGGATSWIIVGVASAAIIIGAYAMSESK